MAEDVDLELQGAIIARLKAGPATSAFVGDRVKDRIDKDTGFPYISWGPSQLVSAKADCIDGYLAYLQIDVWSRAPGYPEVKRIGNAVRNCLDDANLVLPTNAFVSIEHTDTLNLRDPDGLTSHGVLAFEAFVEHPE